jgi:hypothetical protein
MNSLRLSAHSYPARSRNLRAANLAENLLPAVDVSGPPPGLFCQR